MESDFPVSHTIFHSSDKNPLVNNYNAIQTFSKQNNSIKLNKSDQEIY